MTLAELRAGISVDSIRPVGVIARISPRAVLIIHGTQDALVPPDNSARNYAAARPPKELWWVPGAGHAASKAVAGAAYDRRVVAFLRRALDLPGD